MSSSYGYIELNVGGQPFITKYKTLMSSPYFSQLVHNGTPPDSIRIANQGSVYFFIDRGPEIFRDIIYYLQTWQVHHNNETYLKTLNHEAKFFVFDDLLENLAVDVTSLSSITQIVILAHHTKENSLDESSRASSTLHPFGIIKLNVGGTSFSTLYKRVADSKFFHKLIADSKKLMVNQDEVFIDRDGKFFRQMLLILRTGIVFSRDKTALTILLQEASFYQLDSVIHASKETLTQCNDRTLPNKKFALEFMDLRKMFSKEQDPKEAATYTLTKKSGKSEETFVIIDFITVYSRSDYRDHVCAHPYNNEHCRCYYYPKLVQYWSHKRRTRSW